MKYDERVGTFKVFSSEELYGKKEIELAYTLCGSESDELLEQLAFVRNHYQSMYYTVLKNLLLAYKNNPKWDIWNEETHTFSRLDLQKERDVHKYIGEPTVEIMRHEKKILTGLSFYKKNKMSIEHGFCAIFDKDDLLLIGDDDFYNILRYWDYYSNINILTSNL